MNVLSLFDGMSCGQIALNRAGIKYQLYYASEIDKYAINITQSKFPNTIQIGDVTKITASKQLPKNIDLMMGGSPCQSFSFAGKRKGMSTKDNQEIYTLEHYLQLKSEGFEFEGQSYLFWEYVRLLNELKPTYFLLENVMMEERWQNIITKTLNVKPIYINSATFSAQSRERLYWTNIGLKSQGLFGFPETTILLPKDKGILLKDIIQNDVDEKYYLMDYTGKYDIPKKKVRIGNPTVETIQPYLREWRKKADISISKIESLFGNQAAHHWFEKIKFASLPDVDQWIWLKQILGFDNKYDKIMTEYKLMTLYEILLEHKDRHKIKGNGFGIVEVTPFDKAITLTTWAERTQIIKTKEFVRRLTYVECCRLQTLEDDHFELHGNLIIPESAVYKLLGNGWTIDVIAHILSYIKN